MPPSPPRIREVRDSDEEEEGDDDLADFAFERGTGIVGADHLARVASAEATLGSDEKDPGVAAMMAVARIMSATGSKTLPPGLVRLMSPYQAHYDELKLLGKGGFGSVVAAVGRLDDRPVAVKKIHFKSAAPPWAKNDTLESLHEELLREARALALMDDPRVVKYHSAWIEPRWGRLAAMSSDDASISASDADFSTTGREGMGGRRPSLLFANIDNSDSDSDESEDESTSESGSYSGTGTGTESMKNLLPDGENAVDKNKGIVLTPAAAAKKKTKKTFSTARWPYTLFIAMELCPGTTLRDWIRVRPRGDIQAGAGTHIFRATVEALRYIHINGIIHRDVKPANILVHRGVSELEPTVKLMDFGLAVFNNGGRDGDDTRPASRVVYADGQTGNGARKKFSVGVGTASYCAPEQRVGAGLYTSSVDMYSCGVVLVEMLTALGQEATESERLHLIADAKRLELPAELTKSFPKHAALVRELLSMDPSSRPTAATVLRRWPRVNLRVDDFGKSATSQTGMHARLLRNGGASFPANGIGVNARGNIGVAVAAAAGAAAAKAVAGSGVTGDSSYVPSGYGEPRATSSEIEQAAMSAALNQFNFKRSQSLPEAELAAIADAVTAAGEIAQLGGTRSPKSPMRRAIGSPSPLAPATVQEENEGEELNPETASRDALEAEIQRLRERVAHLEQN